MKPNIVFIVIDSFRIDFCGTNLVNTPNIDYLIKNGIFFDHAITSSDYTMSSIQSIFTGRYPFGCGKTKEEYSKLLSKENNFLSIFKNEGYTLFATIGKLLHTLGIGEYFDNNDIVFDESKNIHNGLGEIITNQLTKLASKKPWFYYIHFLDLHRPCTVPSDQKHLKHIERYAFNLSTIDTWIGKFLKLVDTSNTLFVITADHGDYVSEQTDDGVIDSGMKHEAKTTLKKIIPENLKPMVHNKKLSLFRKIRSTKVTEPHEKRAINIRPMKERFLFDDFVRVPLIISGYNIKPRSIFSKQISSVDLMPTLSDIIQSNHFLKTDGKSFFKALNGDEIESRQTYMENAVLWTEAKNPQPSVGIRTDEYKYFRSLNDPKKNVHLYDLKNDPLENNNLDSNAELISKFEKILHSMIKSSNKSIQTDKLDSESEKHVEEELKKLGYI